MGARTFFEVEKVGARTFLRLKKWGQELFWTGEIGGLVVFFDREIPQNPAWVPGKFWTVPKLSFQQCTFSILKVQFFIKLQKGQ